MDPFFPPIHQSFHIIHSAISLLIISNLSPCHFERREKSASQTNRDTSPDESGRDDKPGILFKISSTEQ